MSGFRPVSLPSGAFAFCRTTIAILFWISLVTQSQTVVWIGFLILLISGIMTVRYAPLILVWRYLFDRFFATQPEVVDATGIRFSHFVGAGFAAIALLFFTLKWILAGWITVFILAVLQTSAAFGFCSALKLYQCMTGGSCCRVGKAVRKMKHV